MTGNAQVPVDHLLKNQRHLTGHGNEQALWYPVSTEDPKKSVHQFLDITKRDQEINPTIIVIKIDTNNHSSMCTQVEIIVPWMTNFVIYNSSCKKDWTEENGTNPQA